MGTERQFSVVSRSLRGTVSLFAALVFATGCPKDRLRDVDECTLEARTGERASCVSPGNRPGIGVCKAGYYACIDGGTDRGACLNEVKPSVEVCDGLDNDCDGLMDEDTALDCAFACNKGKALCVAGVRQPCNATEPTGSDIACNLKDDDCDGTVDNVDFTPCYPRDGGLKSPEITNLDTECRVGHLKADCTKKTLDCYGWKGPKVEQCDGLDNDCDGKVDEGCNETSLLVTFKWNGSGDVDAHGHNGADSGWFYQYEVGANPNGDDVFYGNRNPDWGVRDSGTDNPQLDIDNIVGYGPENIWLEKPVPGEIYTFAVHNFARAAGRIVTVSIFCGDSETPKAVYQSCPLSWAGDGGWCVSKDFWKVASVTFGQNGGCTVTEINTYSDSTERKTTF